MKIKSFVGLLRIATLVYVAVSLLTSSLLSADGPDKAKSDSDWDGLFTRNDGWTGGDVAGTIDLKDGRVLWVFGDTWIGRVEDGKHSAGAQLVNNTAAIHRVHALPDGRLRVAVPKEMLFLVGPRTGEGAATAWISNPEAASNEAARSWYWTTGGGITLVRSGCPSLYVFLFRVEKGTGPEGVWNFRIPGTTMAVFDDIRLPVEDWKPRLIDIPFSVDIPGNPDRDDARWMGWGAAAIEDSTNKDDVMIYGVRRQSKLRDNLVLAKVSAADIEKFDRWRFHSGGDQWSDRVDDARPVVEDVSKELSVERLRDGSRFVMVYSEPIFGSGIFLRTADRPEGPWSSRKLIHRVTDKKDDKRFFPYAAKGHAMLSGTDELLVSYIVNSHEFGLMVNDASIYRPRFVWVKLQHQ